MPLHHSDPLQGSLVLQETLGDTPLVPHTRPGLEEPPGWGKLSQTQTSPTAWVSAGLGGGMGIEEPQMGGGGIEGGPRNVSSLQEEGLLLSPLFT